MLIHIQDGNAEMLRGQAHIVVSLQADGDAWRLQILLGGRQVAMQIRVPENDAMLVEAVTAHLRALRDAMAKAI